MIKWIENVEGRGAVRKEKKKREETRKRMEGAGRELKLRYCWRNSAQRGRDGEDEVGGGEGGK